MFEFLKIDYRKTTVYALPVVFLISLEILVYQAFFFMPVQVNGINHLARKGVTADAFIDSLTDDPQPGDLVSVKGKILKRGAGQPPVIKINGKHFKDQQKLDFGDKITWEKGKDIREPLVHKIRYIEIPIKNSGKGAFIIILKKGRMGRERISRGKYSGIVVKRQIIEKSVPTGISRVNIRRRKVVALTFDDGPSKYTLDIVRILKRHKIKATFFVLGRQVKKYPNMIRQLKRNRYVIGNHTYNHISMQHRTAQTIKREIVATDQELWKAARVRTRWVRPPGGALRQAIINLVVLRGKNICMWNTDTSDWQRPPAPFILARVLNDVKPGNVILMHDGGGNRRQTIQALSAIIINLKKKGYKFVTLDQLYGDL